MPQEPTALLDALCESEPARCDYDTAFEIALLHRIKPDSTFQLSALLASRAVHDALRNAPCAHALRFMLLDNGRQVLIHGRFDGPGARGFVRFLSSAHENLACIWRLCEDYPGACAIGSPAFVSFLRAARQPICAQVSAIPSSEIDQILRAIDWMGKTEHYQITLARPPRRGHQ